MRLQTYHDFILSPTLRSSARLTSKSDTIEKDNPTAPRRATAPLMVPRELPSRPDPQSCHYPGFDVHLDTHIELPSTSSRVRAEPEPDLDKDTVKENLPPRKKIKKTVSLPEEGSTTGCFDDKPSDKSKAASYPSTPYHNSPLRTPGTPHHHKSPRSIVKVARQFTPGRVPDAGGTLARKRAMEQEVDEVDSDDEDL